MSNNQIIFAISWRMSEIGVVLYCLHPSAGFAGVYLATCAAHALFVAVASDDGSPDERVLARSVALLLFVVRACMMFGAITGWL